MSTLANPNERDGGGRFDQNIYGDIFYGNIYGSNVGGRENMNNVNNNAQQSKTEELRRIADWLTTLNFHTVQSDTFTKRTVGTGSWFIKSADFKKLVSKNASMLWVTGMPGVGKTILSSIVIDYLQKACSADQHVLFAYCRYTDQLTVKDILASLLKQVLEFVMGSNKESTKKSCLTLIRPVHEDHLWKKTYPSEQELLDLLQKAILSLGKAYIVLDALDELSDHVIDDLLKRLSKLSASLLLTSRPLDLFKSLLPRADHLNLDIQIEGDIELFIKHQLNDSSILGGFLRNEQKLLKEFCNKIKEKSNSMFLVASLQIESLKDCTNIKTLRKAIDLLPIGVLSMYSDTLQRIKAQGPNKSFLAKRALVWVTYGYRPLKVIELQHALAVSTDTETFDEENVTPEDMIAVLCFGLITIDKKSQIVRLVHYTTHDFIKANISDIFDSVPETFMTHSCLISISAFGFMQKTILDFYNLKKFLQEMPLLEYAYKYWGRHANEMSKINGIPEFLSRFIQQQKQYPYSKQDFDFTFDFQSDLGFDIFEQVHIAAYYGFLHVCAISPQSLNTRTQKRRQTPLTLAASEGHEDVVKWLISMDEVEINAKNKDGNTALILAAYKGHEGVAKLLLSLSGVDIDAKDNKGRTALTWAISNGHDRIAKLLLFMDGVDANAKDKDGVTALMMAAKAGREGIVKLLLSMDADINTRDQKNYTALINSASMGHEAVVKLFISIDGVDINARNIYGETALLKAVYNSHYGVIKTLSSINAVDINSKNNFGTTVLIFAAREGFRIVVELLLSLDGIDINAKDKEGNTALIMAAFYGHEGTVKLLLSKDGVDIDAKDNERKTALFYASQKNYLGIVELLSPSKPQPKGLWQMLSYWIK